jgi:hypothetical protein
MNNWKNSWKQFIIENLANVITTLIFVIVFFWSIFLPAWMEAIKLPITLGLGLLVSILLLDYNRRIQQMQRAAKIIEDKVTKYADAFFHEYSELKNGFFETYVLSASKIVVCAPFPYKVLEEYKREIESVLLRGGIVELIFPIPPNGVQNEQDKIGYLETQLNDLNDFFVKNKKGRFYLKTTKYWPSCIYTCIQGDHGGAMLVTINNFGLNNTSQRSFIVNMEDKKTYTVFHDDFTEIARSTQTSGIKPIIQNLTPKHYETHTH